MGNSVSTNACLDVEDLKESTEVALAVAQSLEPAHTPPQDADASYLRQCLKCGQVSYLRQGVCLSPQCTESYLRLPAEEVGRRLQSWGKEDSTTKATSEQMEASRKKRLAQDDWSGSSYKRSKGRKHAGNGQPVSERVCTQELASKGWTSRCGGMENIGFSNQAMVG